MQHIVIIPTPDVDDLNGIILNIAKIFYFLVIMIRRID